MAWSCSVLGQGPVWLLAVEQWRADLMQPEPPFGTARCPRSMIIEIVANDVDESQDNKVFSIYVVKCTMVMDSKPITMIQLYLTIFLLLLRFLDHANLIIRLRR